MRVVNPDDLTPQEQRALQLEQEATEAVRRLHSAVRRVASHVMSPPTTSVMVAGGGGHTDNDFPSAIGWLDEVRQVTSRLRDEAP